MRLVILFLSLLLSGCWVGADFYARTDLRQPLAAGDYRATELAKGATDDGRIRIAHRPDGYITATPIDARGVEDRGDASTAGLAPLDDEGRLFVVWQLMREPGEGPNERIYSLLRREASGDFTLLFPRCEGRDAEAARAAGATVDPADAQGICHFAGRPQLEAALRAAEPHMLPIMRLTPLRQ